MVGNDSPGDQGRRTAELRRLRQEAGIAELIETAEMTAMTAPVPAVTGEPAGGPGVRARIRDDQLRVPRRRRSRGGGVPVAVAARKVTPGALRDWYHIPRVTHERSKAVVLASVGAAAVTLWAGSHLTFAFGHRGYLPLLPVWAVTFALSSLPLFVAWADTPVTTTPRQQRFLDTLNVTVAVPVYNEDPGALDQGLWSAVNQSRPPQCIHVVEDGQSQDYSRLQAHWEGQHGPTLVRWERPWEKNRGKKWAQSRVFTTNPAADVFVTVDSDTTLEYRAIEEGLKPLANPKIASVAGIEEIWNKHQNWLTKVCAARNTFSQLVSWSTQSVFGDVLINRGTFALYRAHIIREIIPAYLGETFLGRPVKLGDDSALTLFSRAHGRTVQQVSAICLPVYPATLSHHFRQWLRWARGGSVRNYWRIKYLPVMSWGWWWTALAFYYTIASLCLPVLFIAGWPHTAHLLAWTAASVVAWSYTTSLHVLRIRREGETTWTRVSSVLAYPAGLIWSSYFLRPIRLYGIFSCFKQGWVTRQDGVEIRAVLSERKVAR